jgi:hypothetical protein
MKRLIAYHLSILICAVCMAQTSLDVSDLSVPTKIAPAYFGPNAFPVPDMMCGRTSSVWKLEAYADNFVCTGYRWDEDYTADAFLRLTIPLFSERANLVIWGPLVEYFQTGSDVCKMRRIDSDAPISKVISGDIYVSTDFMLLTQKKHGIDVSMRAALKTASGNDYATARYYDNAGYFFDAAAAHTFTIIPKRSEFILSASGGFLCWQTDNGRQNDAVMYGLRASYRYKGVSLSSEFGGYVGWEKDGDAPMTLKSTLSGKAGNIILSIGHQIGFRDWPFHQLRIGFAVVL